MSEEIYTKKHPIIIIILIPELDKHAFPIAEYGIILTKCLNHEIQSLKVSEN